MNINNTKSKYEIMDTVIFKKDNILQVGIIESCHMINDIFYYIIRVSPNRVYTPSSTDDVVERDIVGRIDDGIRRKCNDIIVGSIS